MYLACFAHGQRQRRSQLSPLAAQPLVSLPLIAATIAAIVWPTKKLNGRWPKSQRQQKAEKRNNNKNTNNVCSQQREHCADPPADRVQSSRSSAALTLASAEAVPYCSSLHRTKQQQNKSNALLNTHTHTQRHAAGHTHTQ